MRVVAAVIEDVEGRVLLAQRPPGKQHAGQWEFPGGKIEPGESSFDALRRELHEELGIEVESASRFMSVNRQRDGREFVLEAWRVAAWQGVPVAHEHSAIAWRNAHEALSLSLCEADVPICRMLALPSCYAITPSPSRDHQAFLSRIERGLRNGVRLLQWRAPGLEANHYRELAVAQLPLAHSYGARLILNAAPELALDIGADGVHLNSARLMSMQSLPERPSDFLIAASVHTCDELVRAEQLGVDFVVISPVRPTASHLDRAAIGWSGFETMHAIASLPAYTLGGMQLGDVEMARRHGALGIAGISAFW